MLVIYIAGKYRDTRGEWWIRENIREAEKCAMFVWQQGLVALCPHKNTAFWGGMPGCSDDTWLKGDLELLQRCDAMYVTRNWRNSAGAIAEVKYAKQIGVPVLYTEQEVIDFKKTMVENTYVRFMH